MTMVTPGRRWIITDSVLCDRWKNSMRMTGSFGLLSPNSTWHDTMAGTSPGKNVGWTHTASVQREPPANSRGRGPYSGSWKPLSFWMPNGSSKFASFPYFANLRVKLQTLPIPAPLKLTGFASVSGTTFGKSGVDASSCPSESTQWWRPCTTRHDTTFDTHAALAQVRRSLGDVTDVSSSKQPCMQTFSYKRFNYCFGLYVRC